MPVIRVALDVPVSELFDYASEDATEADVGCLVEVPFGRALKIGVAIEVAATSRLDRERLRPIRAIYRGEHRLSQEVLKLLGFCSDYYCHPLGPAVMSSLPTLLRRPRRRAVETPGGYALTERGRSQSLDVLKRAPVQRAVLQAFQAAQRLDATAASALAPTAMRAIKAFVEQGWLEPLDRDESPATVTPMGPAALAGDSIVPDMTPAQAEAVAQVSDALDAFGVFLLHGVTGQVPQGLFSELVRRTGTGHAGADSGDWRDLSGERNKVETARPRPSYLN